MKRTEVERFVQGWIDAWNRRDVEAVVDLFSDHVEFTSPVAQTVVRRGTIEGKAALRAYWEEALRHRKTMHFTLDHLIWDSARRELAIVFMRDVDGERRRACELLQFDATGLVVRGEALHGAVL
jgi:ketosteroid isomerase-like protein